MSTINRVGAGAATATAGAATLKNRFGKITSESLTTAQNAIYTLTVTNAAVKASDIAFASVANGTNTQGTPMVVDVTTGASSLIIRVANKHASAEALNGTLVITYAVFGA